MDILIFLVLIVLAGITGFFILIFLLKITKNIIVSVVGFLFPILVSIVKFSEIAQVFNFFFNK